MGTTQNPDDGAGYGRPLHAVALVKQVPPADHPGTLDGRGRLLRDGFTAELNPWCRRAVTRAVELGRGSGGRTTVVTMGPPAAADVLREAVACGADEGVLVSDPALAGADCLVTAKALAAAVRTLGPVDLLLVGRGTVDGGTGAVGPMVAALLGLPFAGPALSVEAAGDGRLRAVLQLDGLTETAELALPAVLSVAERSCRPAKAPRDTWPDPAPVRTLTAGRLAGIQPGAASPTRVDRVLPAAPTRRPVLLSGTPAEQAARAVELVATRTAAAASPPVSVSPRAHRAAPGTACDLVEPGAVPAGSRRTGSRAAPSPGAGPEHDRPGAAPGALPAGSGAPWSRTALSPAAGTGRVRSESVAAPGGLAAGGAFAGLRGPGVLAVSGEPEGGGRVLLGEAAEIAARIGGHVVAVTPGADPALLAGWGADAAVRLTGADPRPAAAALAGWIRGSGAPWAVLGGATAWDREVLARLAVLLEAGLLSDLTAASVRSDGHGLPRLVGGKPSAGGTLAEVASDGVPQIATLRTGSLAVREPRAACGPIPEELLEVPGDPLLRRSGRRTEDDFDALERAAAVIGLGTGVAPGDHVEVEPLRAALGAEYAATRKVTDAGALPHSRQLGVTGRDIAPRLYVALGVSGSPHHMAGVRRAHTVLAVNSDPDAEVFRHCDIGIVADWRAVVPALAEAFRRTAVRAPAATPA
ncbi:FAD-binding protein [Streptomyces sp. NRRL F-5123]|uniref:FAD-binding protein n=1 Tax=Streptomyces sp. NRRL F-5123 TaxID=1463856 RepID=UPI0006946A80|nr:FAD-binding protein [Streptomyces sp. NRRL F-5123]